MDAGVAVRIREIIEKRTKKIYIYPFGERGAEIYSYLSIRYNIELVKVDNELCEYSTNIIGIDKAAEMIKKEDENSTLLLCSDNPQLYRYLRIHLYKKIDRDKVIDLYPVNPLSFYADNRISSLVMASEQIYVNEVLGEVAEAGVYKGDFAKYINILFPDRSLHLFDTFDGFVREQVRDGEDDIRQTDAWIGLLKDTAVEDVLNKMTYKNMVQVHKGIFPDTAKSINNKFSFVNLDMDLFFPIYEGLNFFWEHLNPGGIIFVHDFSNWDGATKAVKLFCKERKVGYIWLNDRITAAITKPI